MAKVYLDDTTLTGIANQTRRLKQNQETYKPSQMVTALSTVPIPSTPTGTINITQNGTTDVTDYATANVNVQPNLQNKQVSITTNTTTTIQKDTGYDGLGTVEVTTNVPTPTPVLQSKSVTITENTTTTVTPDTGKDGLSSVEIITNVSGADLSEYFEGSISKGSSNGSALYKNIKNIPSFLTVLNTSLENAFRSCTRLTTIGLIDTSSVTNMANMFLGCTSLTTIPQLNTSKVTNMNSMFNNCSSLTSIPLIDTSLVANTSYMFGQCTSLTTIPQLNISSATTIQNMFTNCPLLSNESLNNILAMCINATSFTGTKTLSHLGFTGIRQPVSTLQSLSNYQDFLDAGWTTGY